MHPATGLPAEAEAAVDAAINLIGVRRTAGSLAAN
jgi:hypothetical protein